MLFRSHTRKIGAEAQKLGTKVLLDLQNTATSGLSNLKYGRAKQKADAKRKYPKCVPLAKANRMTEGQRRSAVSRKRAASNVGPKPTNVKTFAGRKKAAMGGYMGTMIDADLGGVKVSNPSYAKYYKGMI